MGLGYYHRHLVLNALFRVLAGQKRKYSRKPKNRTLNSEISTTTSYLSFSHISLYLLMNPDVRKGLGLGKLDSHYSVCYESKYRNFIAANASRYCLYILKTVSFYLIF